MRFAYVAVGVAGFLTATMIDGRVILVSESMSRSTSFQSRSVNPYTNQQTSTSSVSGPPYTPEQTSPTSTGSMTPTRSSYVDGQIVGFKAGLNSHIRTGSASQMTAPTNLFTEDAQFNQGIRAGFQIGLTQHPSRLSGIDAAHRRHFVLGQLAGFQTALRHHSSHHGRIHTGKVAFPISSGNKHLDAGRKAGFEAGISQTVHLRYSTNKVKTDSQAHSGVQIPESAHYEAGQRAGSEFGATNGVKGTEKPSLLNGQNQQFNLGPQEAGFEASDHKYVDGVHGANESARVQAGAHVEVGADQAGQRVNRPTDASASTVQSGDTSVHASARQTVGSDEYKHVGTH